jgi:dTDP-4-amino-4,6-dideoxygalactose transaminase
VREFEQAFAAYCGTRHAVGTGSGLDALRLALLAFGVGPGDEVVVPAQTFVATLEAVTQAGARPVLADVSPADYALDPAATAAAITPRTRCLLPVHLFGQMADMVALRALATARGLDILEDACQAHGARRDGIVAGAGGRAAAFSFYPGKNLGAMGDAGALSTDDAGVDDVVRALREHGQREKYQHAMEGYTSRLDTAQALVLLRKLRRLPGWDEERRRAAAFYVEHLDGVGDVGVLPVPAGSEPVWHLFPVTTADPVRLGAFLRERGVATGRHYPVPPHLTEAYARLGHRAGQFPVAEHLAAHALSLPMYPGIGEDQLARVVEAVRGYFAGG